MLWKVYQSCLDYFYTSTPGLKDASFEEEREVFLSAHFAGWPGDTSRFMKSEGIDVEFIIPNAKSMQHKWAEENGFTQYTESTWDKSIALEQVKILRPDVLWISSCFDYFGEFLDEALLYAGKAVAWIACAVPDGLDVSRFDAVLTSHRSILDPVSEHCRNIVVATPGFEKGIWQEVRSTDKEYDVTIVGNITCLHERRERVMAGLLREGIPVRMFGQVEDDDLPGRSEMLRRCAWCLVKRGSVRDAWGYFRRWVAPSEHESRIRAIRAVVSAPVYGIDMYRVLAASRLTVNVHVDAVGTWAGNMRMFEATGAGSCLVTEHSENIDSIFEPGAEVVTYRKDEDLPGVVKGLLQDDHEVERIANAGQSRTFSSHSTEDAWNSMKIVFE
jgi:hypothetical protein